MIFQRTKVWNHGRLVGYYSLSLNKIKELESKGFTAYWIDGNIELRK